MNDKELYRQKLQAELDEWKAENAKLKAKAAVAKAEAQLTMNKHIARLDYRLNDAQAKLSALAEASEDAWDSVKNGVESAWNSLKSASSDAALRFKS